MDWYEHVVVTLTYSLKEVLRGKDGVEMTSRIQELWMMASVKMFWKF